MKRRRLKVLQDRRKRLPGKGRALQAIRRMIQLGVLLMLIAVPVLSLYANLRNQRDEAGIAARADTALVHALVGGDERRSQWVNSVRGSVWTVKIGDAVVSDPLAAVDFAVATRRPRDAFLLTALIPVIFSLLLGRVFCGWLCPADLLFEAGSVVRRWVGIETDVKFPPMLKYAVLGIGAVVGVALGLPVFADIYPPRILGGELYLWLTFGALGIGAWFLLAVLAFEIFVSRRFWCRYVCPGGALYSLLGRYRLVRLEVVREGCTACDKCQPVCEFGLDPRAGEFGAECNNCGLCQRACAPGVIVWRLGRPFGKGTDDKARATSGGQDDAAA